MHAARPKQVFMNGLDRLPAVRAWLTLATAARMPSRVELLADKRKLLVVRLVGAGEDRTSVIAKRCPFELAAGEHLIYAEILPRLSLDVLRYYGLVRDGDSSWLFLEDAGGVDYLPEDPAHRALATGWIADLHTRGQQVADDLPDRGTQWYLEHLRRARGTIRDNYENPALRDEDRSVLHRTLSCFDVAESNWTQLEALCRLVPSTLVHGDFETRNVRVRDAPNGGVLLVYDWEVSGRGPLGTDLGSLDIELYRDCVSRSWPHMDLEAVQQQRHIGLLLRGGIAPTNWVAWELATPWVERPVSSLHLYNQWMAHALGKLGLSHRSIEG